MKVDHIGIATDKIDEALGLWRDVLGLELDSTEDVAEQGVRVAMLTIGESHIELLEPLSAESPVGRFLAKRGPGVHHVAVRVKDIRGSLAQLKQKGIRLIDETPRVGARGCLVAFVHPSSVNGVLLELVQHE
jgi:methylmalonyl-CoA/ethylmalonyl-CoA epimerase